MSRAELSYYIKYLSKYFYSIFIIYADKLSE